VYVALLTHQTGTGTVGTDDTPTAGRPLHLSLHTDEAAAARAATAAMRSEWDTPAPGHAGLSYTLGPAADWSDADLLAEAEAQGYTITVHEQPVELAE
jgi:hypothetical protein